MKPMSDHEQNLARNSGQPAQQGKRRDIQGLRMIAVVAVFACHLSGWPPGGFIGVDVFLVISGFLITGNLLRTAEATGNVSFRSFYWNRVRRIVPTATVILILTYLVSTLVFLPFRSEKVGVDALFAFFFMSNWWFAYQGTDYFRAAANTVSPLQQYWSLSVEEQFYFVWPALLFLIGLLVARKAWQHSRRMQMAGLVIGLVMVASFAWAFHQTKTAPTLAYFDTASRVWELGAGALLATTVGRLSRIPDSLRPWLSWAGLFMIAASAFLIHETSVGFPAPLALLPVAGSAAVIAAGVGTEPAYSLLLRNPISVYIGDISYSLYLVHWPIIVFAAAVTRRDSYHSLPFAIAVITLAYGLAIISYHFVETPLRRVDFHEVGRVLQEFSHTRLQPGRPTAAKVAVGFISVSLMAYTLVALNRSEGVIEPSALSTLPASTALPPIPASTSLSTLPAATPSQTKSQLGRGGPLTNALQDEIDAALTATAWPQLDPSMESVIEGPETPPEVMACGGTNLPSVDSCTWGSPKASKRVVVLGDSVALAYVGPLRDIALNINGDIQVHSEAMTGCMFLSDQNANSDTALNSACPGRKQHAIDFINETKPDVVVISNVYSAPMILGSNERITAARRSQSLREIVEKFQGNVKKVVFLAAPPTGVDIAECYSTRSSKPADCVTQVNADWYSIAAAEQGLARSINATWIDSLPWLCSGGRFCPSFVGTTPSKMDRTHIAPAYGVKIYPVINESFESAGVF